MPTFYCQNKCEPMDMSIVRWNKMYATKMSEVIKISKPMCAKQCFNCMATVGETRIKNREF